MSAQPRTPQATHRTPLIQADLTWQQDALCRQTDPNLFFPRKGQRQHSAVDICNACPVNQQCLTFALTNGERYGVWGGKTQEEIRKALRRLGRAAS